MRVLFLNPPSLEGTIYMKELGRCGRKSVADEIWPQTGLAYLAAVLEKEKYKVKIVDAMAENLDMDSVTGIIKKFKPKVIVLNTTTPTFENDAKVIEIIKKQVNSLIGFVGTHVSTLPKESLEDSDADFILVGEGEYTLREFVKKVNSSWRNIKGLCYKKNNKIYCNKNRGLISNLDELPLPARHFLPNNKYVMILTNGKPFVTIISSRGCPYQCTFCRAGNVWGKKVRTRSVESVIKEIKYVVENLKIKYIVFMTDTFTLHKDWTIKLCDEIIKNKFNIKWLCNSRVDTIDGKMLRKMKEAGCISISYGIESGSQEILNKVKKGITLEQAEKAVGLTKKVGILTFAYFIVGLPGENWDTVKKSIKFAKKIDPDYANFHIATPFPGTEFYDFVKRNNLLTSNKWSDFEEEGSCVVKTEELTSQELIKAQKLAMRSFYLRPKQIFNQIRNIKNLKGLKVRIKIGISLLLGQY